MLSSRAVLNKTSRGSSQTQGLLPRDPALCTHSGLGLCPSISFLTSSPNTRYLLLKRGPAHGPQTPRGRCCYSVPASAHLLPWDILTAHLCYFSRALSPRLSCLVIQLQNESWSGRTNRSGEEASPADGDCTGKSPPLLSLRNHVSQSHAAWG